MTLKKTALALAMASSVALVGCGGGGSSSDTNTGSSGTDGGSVSARSVSGSAVKGVMKYASVTAYELNDAGDRMGSVGTTETDGSGNYELTLDKAYKGGLIEIEVTATSKTRMICDAAACGNQGEEISLPSGFKLNAIATKAADSDKVSAPVTAWSTMAAKRAKALIAAGSTAAEASRQATAEVNDLAGFDVSKTTARAVTDLSGASAEEQQAAVMNAAVAALVFASGDAADNLEKFASALDDGQAGNDGDSFTVAELSEATTEAANSTSGLDSDAKSALSTKTGEYDANPDGYQPTYDAELDVAEDATQADKINAFKTFVSQARTWATSIENLNGDELEAAMGAKADTFNNVLGGNVNSLQMSLMIAGQALNDALVDPAALQTAMANGDTVTVPVLDAGVEVGSMKLAFSDNAGLVIGISGQVTGQAAVMNFDLALNTNIPTSALDLNAGSVSALTKSTQMVLSGTFDDGQGTTLAKLNDVTLKLELSDAVSNANGVSTTEFNQVFVGASAKGSVELAAASGESFNGTIDAGLIRLTGPALAGQPDVPVSFDHLKVTGEFANSDGTVFRSSAALNVNNSAAFDTFGWNDYSEAGIYTSGPIDANYWSGLFQIPGEAIAPAANLEAYKVAPGEFTGQGSAVWYEADSQPKYNSRNLDVAERETLANDLRDSLLATLPAQLTLQYYDPQSATSQQLQVNTSDLLGQGVVDSYNISNDGTVSVTVALSSNPVPVGDFADVLGLNSSIGENGNIYMRQLDTETPVPVLDLWLVESQKVDPLAAILQNLVVGLTDAKVTQYYSDNVWDSHSISISRNAEKSYFDECVADPMDQLHKLGRDITVVPNSNRALRSCADATLSWMESPWVDLSPEQLSSLVDSARTILTDRYGQAGQKATINNLYASSWSGAPTLSIFGQFPDLETANNFIDASFTVTSAVNIPELPEAKVVATVARNTFAGGKVLATVNWSSGQYSLEVGTKNVDSLSEVTARFFNPQGYELTMAAIFDQAGDLQGLSGDALLNGEDIGDVTLRNGMPVITYPNGSTTEFETLF